MEPGPPPTPFLEPTPDPGANLTPLDVGQVISAGCRLYAANFGALILATAAVIVPLEIVAVIVNRIDLPSGIVAHGGNLYTTTGVSVPVAPEILLIVLEAVVTLVGSAAAYRLALGRFLDFPTAVTQAFGVAVDRGLSLIWVGILTEFLVAVGFVLIIVPGIYLAVCFAVALPVLLVEGHHGVDALTTSRDLVRGNWVRCFGVIFPSAAVFLVCVLILGTAGGHSGGDSITGIVVGRALADGIVTILLAPLIVSIISVLYVDLRVRAGADTAALIAPDW